MAIPVRLPAGITEETSMELAHDREHNRAKATAKTPAEPAQSAEVSVVQTAPLVAVAGLARPGEAEPPPSDEPARSRSVVGVLRQARPLSPDARTGETAIAIRRVEVLRRMPAQREGCSCGRPTHRVAPTTIQREKVKQLTSKEVLAGLRTIPIVNQKLDAELAQGPSGAEHVKRALAAFDKHLALKAQSNNFVNEAIRIATVIDATAAELARAVNDPTLKWQIAKELIAAYRTELQNTLGSAKKPERDQQTSKALDLATVVVSDDPVTLYMTDKLKIEDAAWKVRHMAAEAKVSPLEMLRILRMRFEMELGSYTANEVQAGRRDADTVLETDSATGAKQTGKAGFDLADLIGEISPTFYQMVVPAKQTAKERAKLPEWATDGLAMQGKATQRLDDLEKKVLAADLKSTALSSDQLAAEQAKSGNQLSEKQSEHFARLRDEEATDANDYEGEGKSPREYLNTHFMTRYGIDQPAADSLIDDVLAELATVPLTLTSKLENLFAERPDKTNQPKHGSAYKSEPALMQQEVDVSALVGKPERGTKADSIGQPDDNFKESRGENYLRWRRDKDERETGFHGLGADDLPVFAAVNPNFMETKGGNANLAQWDAQQGKYTGTTYGENYYGDMHMLLKDSVRPRSTLIARGKKFVKGRRIERTDLTFLLADMCRLAMFDYVDAMVASVKKPDVVVLTNMDAEVHVYGGLDIASDVEAIYLQSTAMAANDGAAARCKQFAQDHGIAVKDIGTMPVGYNITGKQGLKGGIDLKGALANP